MPRKKRITPLNVYCSEAEKEEIKKLAARTGHSVSDYLRLTGLNYKVTGIVDHQEVLKILRVDGDNRRLGGLLKMWLTRDKRVDHFQRKHINYILGQIEEVNKKFIEISQNVLAHNGRRKYPRNLESKKDDK